MDRSYIKSEEKASVLGEWILFFNILGIFFWLVYELYKSFNSEPTYRWESSFNVVGLSMGLIFVFLFLFFISKSLVKKHLS
ncbi:MAG: hypothetical protein CMG55_08445 [Candidatus Marinimicrobia bacterium]|nr:hypothetical protein [Candidatus Neomarinimicrobiota bacterium]|tara:strand:+ start:251 stop:493 length:243 start_codon:yes stop_codon:yes gene_type:complete